MTNNPLLVGLRPVHPGEVLREDIIPAIGMPKTEIARLLRVSRQTLYDILGERKPVTSQMALRLARMFGGGPEIWLRMQQNFDLATIAVEMADELADIPVLMAA